MNHENVYQQLLTKINSKFQATAILLGFNITMFSITFSYVGIGSDVLLLRTISQCLQLLSLPVFISSLLFLDKLTMPKVLARRTPKYTQITARNSKNLQLKPSDIQDIKESMLFCWVALTLVPLFLIIISFVPTILTAVSSTTVSPRNFAQISIGGLVAGVIYSAVIGRVAERRWPALLNRID